MGHQPATALTPPATDLPSWHQVNLRFDGEAAQEPAAIRHLGELVDDTTVPETWFFLRKAPWWRLRFHARPDEATALYHRLHRMAGDLAEWVVVPYEPETRAFGGERPMRTAHELFARDSRHVLTYLAGRYARPERADQRDQISVLLCMLLLRTAGMDWYEQGDVWDRVAKHRDPQPGQAAVPDREDVAAVRRLLQLDTARVLHDGQMTWMQPWADAYTSAGTGIGVHHAYGRLERGIRAVLAHHVLFAWNRIGLSPTDQAHLAHAAAAAVFDD